jgi:hypothetical protein
MANSKIKQRSLEADAVDAAAIEDLAITNAKLAGSITNAKLSNSSVTFNGITVALGASGTIPTGEGDLPTISTSSLIGEPSSDTSLSIAGTNFVSIPKVEFIKTTGAIVTAPTVTFNSATSLTVTTVSAAPAWVTASGSLGSVAGGGSVSFTVEATDATSYAKQSGTFPGGVTINSSTGVISGTETGSSSTTVYTFTIRATDAEAQTSDREFSITISHGLEQGFAFI